MAHSQRQNRTEEAWPWNCTQCGTTIYHDATTCRDCASAERAAEGDATRGRAGPVAAPAAWMRRQSYPGLVWKTAVVATAVLLLATALSLSIGTPVLPGGIAG